MTPSDGAESAKHSLQDRRYPLAALTCREVKGRTRIHKYMFLLQERAGFQTYQFQARDYGPYSRGLSMDFNELVASGFIEEDERLVDGERVMYYYSASDDARELVASADDESLEESICTESVLLHNEYSDEKLIDLINDIYSEYPRMARNSVI